MWHTAPPVPMPKQTRQKICHKLPLCHTQTRSLRKKSHKNNKICAINPFGTHFVLYIVSGKHSRHKKTFIKQKSINKKNRRFKLWERSLELT